MPGQFLVLYHKVEMVLVILRQVSVKVFFYLELELFSLLQVT